MAIVLIYALIFAGSWLGLYIWDRLGLWTLVAVALIAMAYAYPLFHMLSMERFGSPGFTSF